VWSRACALIGTMEILPGTGWGHAGNALTFRVLGDFSWPGKSCVCCCLLSFIKKVCFYKCRNCVGELTVTVLKLKKTDSKDTSFLTKLSTRLLTRAGGMHVFSEKCLGCSVAWILSGV